MSDTDTLIRHFIVDGRRRLDTFERSLFHEKLRSPTRDNYTKLFEETPEEALAYCEKYLRKAKKCNAPASAISSIQSSTGCWELGTAKSPRRIKLLVVISISCVFVCSPCIGVQDIVHLIFANRPNL